MSSQTTRTSSPHHLLYRLEGKDDVLSVWRARGGGVRLCVNKVFTAAILDVYSHVVSWRARATRSCKWPNSPNFPSVVEVVVVVVVVVVRCPGLEESGAWPGCLACQGYLSATHWLESGSCSARRLYTVHQSVYTPSPPPICTMNVSLYATSCYKMKSFN